MNQTVLHVQHTPNPDAQDPPLVPPLLEHSSLKKAGLKNIFGFGN